MRKKLVSSAFVILAGAGGLGYLWHRAEPSAAVASAGPRAAAGDKIAAISAPPRPALPPVATADVATDRATMSKLDTSGEHFPDTAIGRALDQHLRILVDVNPGADDRKQQSLAALRKHAREASQGLLDAYHKADAGDEFGRWLLSQTLAELGSDEGYPGLQEIARSPIPETALDSDRDGNAAANESAIRQAATGGLAALARGGNAAADQDLLALALGPPSGDDAVRTMAIKGYLAAGSDYAARVQALEARLPSRYHDVVTLTVTQPEDATPPDHLPPRAKHGG